MHLSDFPDSFSSDKPDPCPCGMTPIIRRTGATYTRYQIRCPSASGWDFDCVGRGCGMSERLQSIKLPNLIRRWNEHVYYSSGKDRCPRCHLHGQHECSGSAVDYSRSGLSVGGY